VLDAFINLKAQYTKSNAATPIQNLIYVRRWRKMVLARIISSGFNQRYAEDPYISALREVGVDVEELASNQPHGYGVLFFDKPNEEVYRFLQESSDKGRARIIAVKITQALRSDETWRLLKAGAADVLLWNLDQESAEQIKARLERWAAVDALLESDSVQTKMVGTSRVWRSTVRELVEAAYFTTLPVLLMGESGTGKELAAHLIHELDPRLEKANIIVLDCTTIVPSLAGSEFFGHERGAFTGAVAQRNGVFALANGGTLFLDEIGELSMPLQAQLLRVMQEGTYKRVGGNTWQRTRFRLVCATNHNLEEQVRRGAFRYDLYFRIASLVYTLPPLRDRPEDILPLVRHFMREMRPEEQPPELDMATQDYFLRHDYRGNVRELKQRVARLIHRYAGGGLLSVGNIPVEERPSSDIPPRDWKNNQLEEIIRCAIALGAGLKEISRTVGDIAVRIAVDDAGGTRIGGDRPRFAVASSEASANPRCCRLTPRLDPIKARFHRRQKPVGWVCRPSVPQKPRCAS
jgi:DNA-binding NtrC family response regulator